MSDPVNDPSSGSTRSRDPSGPHGTEFTRDAEIDPEKPPSFFLDFHG